MESRVVNAGRKISIPFSTFCSTSAMFQVSFCLRSAAGEDGNRVSRSRRSETTPVKDITRQISRRELRHIMDYIKYKTLNPCHFL